MGDSFCRTCNRSGQACLAVLIGLAAYSAFAQSNVQGKWNTLSASMTINPVHVALLANGKVLVVAGSGNCPASQSGCPSGPPYSPSTNGSGALLMDPATGQVLAQFSLSWDMFCNSMVLLEDGRALIDGGTLQYDPFHGQPQSAIFDPSTNTFTNTVSMMHGRWYPTVLTLADGRVMTFSGLDENGNTNPEIEFYTSGSGWSLQSTATWTPDLYPRLHLLPDGKVFYSGAQTTSKLFDPSTGAWNTTFATTNYSGTRLYGTSVLMPLMPANNYDPKLIILGGGNPATKTTEIIDLGASTPKWQYGPNMSQARIEMNAVILPSGKILALGGSVNDEDATSASFNADLYDSSTNTFSSAGANAYPRLYHSVALLLPDGTVWLAGGNPSRGTYQQQIEIYQPAYLFNSNGTLATRPSITNAPASVSYGSTFTVSTPDAASVASVVLVRNGTVTHAFATDQREVGLTFTAGNGALMVSAPPNGNIAPPGYYMLFILNSSGVPSVANFVQVTTAQPDFSLTATPAYRTAAPSTGTGYTLNVAAVNGFSGNVSFAVGGLPAGASASFSPNSISGSGTATMTVSTSSSTPTGTYKITVTGSSGTLTHSAQVTLLVADFAISVSPASQTVTRPSNAAYSVTVTRKGPFVHTVRFSVMGLPAHSSSSFSPPTVTGSGNSTLTISTAVNTPTGTYTVTVVGKGNGVSHSAPVSLVVQ
ncbi:MAG: DUF1929 domain-containing protein [Acidobacteria bacterium]|nr:DUF1929 domain-containing protein [Acidobacteriota bacterium]